MNPLPFLFLFPRSDSVPLIHFSISPCPLSSCFGPGASRGAEWLPQRGLVYPSALGEFARWRCDLHRCPALRDRGWWMGPSAIRGAGGVPQKMGHSEAKTLSFAADLHIFFLASPYLFFLMGLCEILLGL